jgi:hypothetical protein
VPARPDDAKLAPASALGGINGRRNDGLIDDIGTNRSAEPFGTICSRRERIRQNAPLKAQSVTPSEQHR